VPIITDSQTLADLLPGTWHVAASNLPLWLSGEGLEPKLGYELVSTQPLVLASTVSFSTTDGEARSTSGVDTLRGSEFRRRGKGRQRLFPSRWEVAAQAEGGTIAVIRYAESRSMHSGLDILVRVGSSYPNLRAMVAHASTDFGLSPEDFASLSWFAERK
jgi:hypothetical protein